MFINKNILFLSLFLMLSLFVSVKAETGRDAQDSERLIRLEEGQKSMNQRIDGLENSLNKRIDGVENNLGKRMDDIRGLLYVILGSMIGLLGSMIGLVGFVMWDRKTALSPAIKKNRELEEREELMERVFKEYAKVEPKFGEILKSFRII